MSKKTHEKQVARARAKRQAERAVRRRRRTQVIVLLLVGLLAAGVFAGALLVGGDEDDELAFDPDQSAESADPTEQPSEGDEATAVACENPSAGAPESTATVYDEAPPTVIDPDKDYIATIETTCGTIVLDLYTDRTPETVNNFVFLAQEDYYAGSPFHRVIDDFMIQGGDPSGTGSGGPEGFPGYTIADELELAEEIVDREGGYPRGMIAMARPSGAGGAFLPDSAGSQFFIMQAAEPYPLPPQYAIFGETVQGLDVIDRIAQGPAQNQLAIDPVVIIDVTIEEVPADAVEGTPTGDDS